MQELPVRIVYKDKKHSSGKVENGTLVLYISSRLPRAVQEEHIRVLTERLARRAAAAEALAREGPAGPAEWGPPSGITTDQQLAAWAQELNQRWYGFAMGAVRFKRQKARWGSCSGRTRHIYISDRLRNGPRDLLEYVLIHELCHLGELNHGPRFWRLVARACPDFQERRARLRRYGLWLGARGG